MILNRDPQKKWKKNDQFSNNEKEDATSTISAEDFTFEMNRIIYDENSLKLERTQGLGAMRLCILGKQKFLLRTTPIKNISLFIYDEIKKDIFNYQKIRQEYVVPLRACSSDEDNVYILSEYEKNGSLGSLLHKQADDKKGNFINYSVTIII